MSTTFGPTPMQPPTEETRSLAGYALVAVDGAIRDAAYKLLEMPDSAEREAVIAELRFLYDERLRLISQHIETIVNSPAVQDMLRLLTVVVAELEAKAAKLKDATKFLKELTKVTTLAKNAVAAIEAVKRAGTPTSN